MIKEGIETFSIKIIVKINTNIESNTEGVNDNNNNEEKDIFTNLQIFKYELETLRDTYLNKYLLKIQSFNDNCDNVSEEECKKIKDSGNITYQKDIPPYNLGLQGKGVQNYNLIIQIKQFIIHICLI